MDKEDYVKLEVAKVLAEKGFDEFCDAYYTCDWGEKTEDECFDCGNYPIKNSNDKFKICAPTLYEAAKWLRKNHSIYLDIGPVTNTRYDLYGDVIFSTITTWTYDIYNIATLENKCIKVGNENFKLYEDCFNKAIYEALKLI
jgi:hypothetical protein